jgi:hypothetical protein
MEHVIEGARKHQPGIPQVVADNIVLAKASTRRETASAKSPALAVVNDLGRDIEPPSLSGENWYVDMKAAIVHLHGFYVRATENSVLGISSVELIRDLRDKMGRSEKQRNAEQTSIDQEKCSSIHDIHRKLKSAACALSCAVAICKSKVSWPDRVI